jgi:hypothetical protein
MWRDSTETWTLNELARAKYLEYCVAGAENADEAVLNKLSAEYEAICIAAYAEKVLGVAALKGEGL